MRVVVIDPLSNNLATCAVAHTGKAFSINLHTIFIA